GTSALGALELGTGGSWGGPWNSEFKQYEIYSIEGETHLFEPGASANYYWSLWVDEKESFVGACEAELVPGDRVLFFPACFGTACPPPLLPLGIQAPASADVGEPISVTVTKYASGGEASPTPGATVAGGAANVTTDPGGHATVTFSHPGLITLLVSAPNAVRTETTVCVHAGNDGNCGTPAPSGSTTTPGTNTSGVASFVSRYTGPFALVASATGVLDGHVYAPGRAPRLLSGKILAHSPVSAVSLELRRQHRGICSAYDAVSERF